MSLLAFCNKFFCHAEKNRDDGNTDRISKKCIQFKFAYEYKLVADDKTRADCERRKQIRDKGLRPRRAAKIQKSKDSKSQPD